tara:strand:+ start:79 stop:783 length:705 start_codon:yes stop_codon:yes gene_type:complete
MFISNKYKMYYDNIIENANSRVIQGYVEKHHIIPRCMGGSDDDVNIVSLTAREHFVCHRLLTKFTTGEIRYKMLHAVGRFVQDGKNTNRKMTSKQYSVARLSISEARLGRKHSAETCAKISESAKGRIPWNKGLVNAQVMSDSNKHALSVLYSGKSYVDRYGQTHADLIKQKMSESKKGHTYGMTGKHHSEATLAKMRKSRPGSKHVRTQCPYCDNKEATARHIRFCKIKENKL